MSNEDLTNIDVVLYSLCLLGGTQKKVFTEDIAKKSFELAPSRFSWRRYPEYPDIEPTRKSLMDARNGKALITGRAGEAKGLKPSDGWIFSPKGIAWIEKNKSRIARTFNISGQKSVNRTTLSKKLNELVTSTAYNKFLKEKSCANIKPYEFTDFLNASLDTPPAILRDRVDRISALAADGKNEKLLNFISACKKYFSDLLSS
ncbi:MAG: hypothetical protein Q8P10_03280 [bacterium]|nr:hypothetical protein [bacterium]